MKEKIVHLFRVPKEWSNDKIRRMIEKFQYAIGADKGQGVIVRDDVSYESILIKEGDKLTVIRDNDVLEVIS